MIRLALLALLALPLAAQITVVGESSGGGGGGAPTTAEYWLGAANGSLSAEIVVDDIDALETAIGSYDFSDAANLTGNIAAARMSANVLAAFGGALSNDRVPYISGGVASVNTKFRFDGTNLEANAAGEPSLRFSGPTTSLLPYGFVDDENSGLGRIGADVIGLYVGTIPVVTVGGSQSFLLDDSTASTGVTLGRVDAGAGQGSTALWQWRNNAGTVLSEVESDGIIDGAGFKQGNAALNYSHLAGTIPDADVPESAVAQHIKATLTFEVFLDATTVTTGNGAYTFPVPVELNTFLLTGVQGYTYTAGQTGTMTVQIARCAVAATGDQCGGTPDDMLSTKLTWDDNEVNTTTSAVAVAIDTDYDDLTTNQVLRIDVDSVHSGTAATGMKLKLTFSPAP